MAEENFSSINEVLEVMTVKERFQRNKYTNFDDVFLNAPGRLKNQ